jgi:hypothetical protein
VSKGEYGMRLGGDSSYKSFNFILCLVRRHSSILFIFLTIGVLTQGFTLGRHSMEHLKRELLYGKEYCFLGVY